MANEYRSLRRKVVFDHLDKFPDTPSRTIARIIFRDNPLLFKDIEDARTLIRHYRGQQGVRLRRYTKQKRYYTYEKV